MFSIGLPEAFVQDLSIHWNPAAPNGGLKLLRAAIQARGVWEVDISANPASVGKSFLRVHPLDTRRILPTSLTNLTDESATPTPVSALSQSRHCHRKAHPRFMERRHADRSRYRRADPPTRI